MTPFNRALFRRVAVGLTCLLAILFLTVPALAQTAARIEGSVIDKTGAVVPNVKVTALNVKTQFTLTATTNAQGLFVLTPVPPGVYTVTAESTGFAKEVLTNLEVNVAGIATANFKLTVGGAGETIEVKANEVSVQTADATISRAITMKDIDTLPQLGRTPITLSVFQPGVQMNAGDPSFSRINGQRQGSNNATLDGIDVNDSVVPRLGLSLTANNTDSVGEFRIVTQGAKAEYGRNAGGQVEMVTRSGTNKFHGNAYDYLRNTDMNANDYFNKLSGSQRPKFIQNIYGGSVGGPIMKDKWFIFGNYQGRQTKQEIVRNRTVLTDNARQGLFTYKDSTGAIRTYSIVANDPRGLGIDPQMMNIINMLPHSNNCDVGDGLNTCGFRFNNPNNSLEDQFTIRGDYYLHTNHKFFMRWSWQRNSAIDSLNSADATFPGQQQGTQGGHRWGYSIGYDMTISPTWVNEFRFGHQSAIVAFNRPARLSGPTIISNSFTDPINSAYAQGRNSPVENLIDNMTKTWGNHTFKWGGKFSYTQQQGYNYAGVWQNVTLAVANGNNPPSVTFPGGLFGTTVQAYQRLYNDLLGRMDSVAETFYSNDLQTFQAAGIPRVRNYILNEQGYYFQDDWRVNRKLTLNIGLRWELFLPPHEQNGIQAVVQNANQVTLTNTSTNLTVQQSTNWYKTDWNNFAPRFGFAFDPWGDGKTAIRGNYGVFFDRMIGATVSLADGNTPGFAQGGNQLPQTFTAAQITAMGCGSAPVGDVRISDCIPLPAVPASPSLTLPVGSRTTSIVLFNPNLRTPYVQSFGLSLQHEILRNTVIEIGYTGARGVKLFMDLDYNQMRIDESFLAAFKQFQAYRSSGTPIPGTNPILMMFGGNVSSAVTALGATNIDLGNVGAAANSIDRSNNSRYATAGLPQTYLRSYPQFNQLIMGTNAGRSYYDAMQVSVRRSTGALRMAANYTWSKSIDNISVDGNGFTTAIDNRNPGLNRALGDYDHRHNINASFIYTMPFGRGQRFGSSLPRWLDTIVGGWDLGSLFIAQDGSVFTVNSQRTTRHLTGTGTTGASTTWANYSGPKDGGLHVQSNGTVFWFNPDQVAGFTYPAAGEYGNSGRNAFRGPRFIDVDSSLVKRFKIIEGHSITFRAEAYNLFNHPNFTNPSVDITSPSTFGKISSTAGQQGTGSSARVLQVALRYDF
jgi:hypothetical protein